MSDINYIRKELERRQAEKELVRLRSTDRDPDKPFFDREGPVYVTQGRLPHFDQPGAFLSLTAHLTRCLPQSLAVLLERRRILRSSMSPAEKQASITNERKLIEDTLHQTINEFCFLRFPEERKIVEDSIWYGDERGYFHVLAFVIMPNHLHLLVRTFEDRNWEDWWNSFKQFTATRINRLHGVTGPLWQKEPWDRLIRSGSHYINVREYIRDNPKTLSSDLYTLYISPHA